jgi:hypothetical protein
MKVINRIICLTGSIFILLMTVGCDPLDKSNLSAISTDEIFSNAAVAEAYVNNIYASFLPGLDEGESRNTDEAMESMNSSNIPAYLNGTITADSYNYYPYDGIRNMNIFLQGIDGATFDAVDRNRLKGETLFWRAWAYFRMVRAYGGVPLILKPESPTDTEAIFVPRNTTSECFAQILKDLDEAIALLPDPSGNARIDKGVAMAFKGRVALFQASPQFNRSGDSRLWQAAYDANSAADTYLTGQGKGLIDDYGKLYVDEMNREIIMVRRYSSPEAPNGYFQVGLMPLKYTESGNVNVNRPSLDLVNAYPMKDGSKWDPATMDYRKLWENRDERFNSTIVYNGYPPYLKVQFGVENMWIYRYEQNGTFVRTDMLDQYESRSGFYAAKMVDPTLEVSNKLQGQTDWIEIRYAEVIMNLAEAANETGKADEALAILYRIRGRAGIEAGGNGKYGITASTQAEIRQAIMDERFVEFTFETKRFWDLRRWRIYKSTMEGLPGSTRHGLWATWAGTGARPTGLEDISTIWDQFTTEVVNDIRPITMLDEDKYSFFGIPATYLERNSKLEQNNTWGGTFDPLK